MKKPLKKKVNIPASALILCGALLLLLVIVGAPTLKRAYENTIKPFFVPAKESSRYINLDKWGVRIPLSPDLRGKVMAEFYTNNGYGEAFDFYTSDYMYAPDKINENGKARLLMTIARIPSSETPFYGEASDYFGEKVVANIDGYKYYFVLADTNESFVNICARLINNPSPTQTCNNILPLRSSLYKALLKLEPMPSGTAKESSRYINLDDLWDVRVPLPKELQGKIAADPSANDAYGEVFDFSTPSQRTKSRYVQSNKIPPHNIGLQMRIARVPDGKVAAYAENDNPFGESIVASVDGYTYYLVHTDSNEFFLEVCNRHIDDPDPAQTCNNILPLRSSLYKALLNLEPMPPGTAKDNLDL